MVQCGQKRQKAARMGGECAIPAFFRVKLMQKRRSFARFRIKTEGRRNPKRKDILSDVLSFWRECSYRICTYEFKQNKIEAQRSGVNFGRRSRGASAL